MAEHTQSAYEKVLAATAKAAINHYEYETQMKWDADDSGAEKLVKVVITEKYVSADPGCARMLIKQGVKLVVKRKK